MIRARAYPICPPAAVTYRIAATKWRPGVQKPLAARYSRAMISLTATENAAIERAADAPMLSQVERWAAINSGTGNLAGLKRVAGELADAFSALPGEIRLVAADPVESVDAAGQIKVTERGDQRTITLFAAFRAFSMTSSKVSPARSAASHHTVSPSWPSASRAM